MARRRTCPCASTLARRLIRSGSRSSVGSAWEPPPRGPGSMLRATRSSTAILRPVRAGKHAFEPVEPRAILERLVELPIAEWSYRTGDATARHMGPVSEDFSAAFGLGRDDRHVSPVDLSGVAFAAIQGLHVLVRERDAEIEELKRSRDALEARLEALESRLE